MADNAAAQDTGADTGSQDSSKADISRTQDVLPELAVEELQGLPSISDAELGAPDESSEAKDDSEDSQQDADDSSSSEDKSADSGSSDDEDSSGDNKNKDEADDDSETDDKDSDSGKEDDKDSDEEKVPKGYVKLEALREARNENKFLKGEIAKLKVRIFESKAPTESTQPLVTEEETAEFEDFKILSEKEFHETYEEEPTEGLKYTQKLIRYQDYMRRLNEQEYNEKMAEKDLETASEQLQQIFDTSAELMEKVVPGIFDDETVQSEFRDFAEDLGFTDDLFYLTNPETRIILPGESEALLLGEQAASIMQVLANARTRISASKQTEAEAEKLTKEIEARVRKEVEAELLKKFKKDNKQEFQSLDDIPDSEGDNKYTGQVLSAEEFGRLSDDEQESYLAGP